MKPYLLRWLRAKLFTLLSIAYLCAPVAVMADTDYRCLNTCSNGGGSSTECLKKCTYSIDKTKSYSGSPAKAEKFNHKGFDAPQNGNGVVVLDTKEKSKQQYNKDFQCFSKCLKEGMQYQLCEGRCNNASQQGTPVSKKKSEK